MAKTRTRDRSMGLEMTKRPNMPLGVKLAACLITMGYHPEDAAKAAGIKLPRAPSGALAWSAEAMGRRPRMRIDFDHCPALALRRLYFSGGWEPSANDPRWIAPMGKPLHAEKTKADIKAAAKVKRLAKKASYPRPPKPWPEGDRMAAAFKESEDKAFLEEMKKKLKKKRAWPKGRKIATRMK